MPESTRLSGPQGKSTATRNAAKASMLNAFRLNIQGLEAASPSILRVSAISARRPVTSSIGVLRSAQQASLDCSSLTLAVVERDAGPFFSWFNESLKGSATERPGRLEFLGIDGRTLAIADLGNLGILRYAPAPFPATDSGIPRVQVDLYCETLNLSV